MAVTRTQKEIRQRAPLWLLALLGVNLVLMSVTARDESGHKRLIQVWAQAVASPVQRLFSGATGAGMGFFQHLGSLNRAATENEDLRRRLAETEAELRKASMARDENERLRGLLDFREKGGYQTVTARVIARDPSEWFDSVMINRGSTSGIEKDMPVVTHEGIVGRIIGVSPVTAQVLLITDERAAAGAVVGQLGTSQAMGSVRGYGSNGLLDMRYVSGLEAVKQGDLVVTTGQDSIYPAGLSVGQVVEFKQGSATSPHEIRVKPSARLNSLGEVAVLLYHPPPRTPPPAAATTTAPSNTDRERK
ncbi:MAG TPA: rod shape-determining protein MreC [Pyrinomonadaceae bacterium]|nr:rod shape-determining protein MreC [Pyrinomonadaceae bacterium]